MNLFNWNVINALFVWAIALTNVTTNNIKLNNVQVNTKYLVDNILNNLENSHLTKIYNPMNPDWIDTDDWYIYIV
jgi:hypothetical protein